MLHRKRGHGFTLIELLIAVAVLVILVAVAIPSYRVYLQKSQLTGASEAVFNHLQYARSEALSNGTDIFFAFKGTGATGWCLGVSDTAPCDCAASLAACTINTSPARFLDGDNYPDITVTTNFTSDDSGFTAPRSVANEIGSVTVNLPGYGDAEVRLSLLGRLRLCSDTLTIYAGCP